MNQGGIDEALEHKIKPILDEAMRQYLGITVDEIRTDITDKLKTAPFFEFNIHADKPYKRAKELFRREFLTRLLRKHFGNVSITAKIAGLDRRSMHRLVDRHGIEVGRFREEMTKRSYLKQAAITQLLESTIKTYTPGLNKERVENLYAGLLDLSKNIVDAMPEREISLEEAEKEWERRYLIERLEREGWNVSATARSIGLRYETMHRKMKELMIEKPVKGTEEDRQRH